MASEFQSTRDYQALRREFIELGLNDAILTRVFETIGAASMCWKNVSAAGVFNADAASKIGFDLCRFLKNEFVKAPGPHQTPGRLYYEANGKLSPCAQGPSGRWFDLATAEEILPHFFYTEEAYKESRKAAESLSPDPSFAEVVAHLTRPYVEGESLETVDPPIETWRDPGASHPVLEGPEDFIDHPDAPTTNIGKLYAAHRAGGFISDYMGPIVGYKRDPAPPPVDDAPAETWRDRAIKDPLF